MAKSNDSIPPVPVPPSGATPPPVPPVEPAPKTKPAAKAPAAVPAAVPAAAAVAPPPPVQSTPTATYAQPAYTPPPAGPAQGLSITSMILGIAGLFLGLLFSLAAVITGHMAQKSQPYAKPFWLTGIITGYVGIALGIIVTIAFIAWFAFIFTVAGPGSFNY